MNYRRIITSTLLFFSLNAFSQSNSGYWQQEANYIMEVSLDVKKHRYQGKQELAYTNNSPDTLKRVFFHLYFNAFQPGSEMDVRSLTIKDADKRVGNRISKLKSSEIGFVTVDNFKLNGQSLDVVVNGTIAEVDLKEYILPHETVTFNLDFKGQVPQQIRRSGRDNKEGVAYSMVQWFPKIAAFDERGWHANPYIGREFYSPFGSYDVKITLDADYIVGGTGVLQKENISDSSKLKTWHFKGEHIHDFAWAADPDYIHDTLPFGNQQTMHFYYKNDPEIVANWKRLQPKAIELMQFFEAHIGPYPYPQYSIIQGGDGGMEYAMCTLITGKRKYGSLVGVTAHEMAHAWFQHIMGTDESNYEWMDEGFTTYISTIAKNYVTGVEDYFPLQSSYNGYRKLVESGIEQPQTTHSDRYKYNYAYGIAAYSKGAVFLSQLGEIIGEEALAKTLRRYYDDWRFKHPKPNDFIRVAEKVTGLELSWYLQDWTTTTNTIDYKVNGVEQKSKSAIISLKRKGLMPVPLTVDIIFDDNSKESYYIPLRMMRGHKPLQNNEYLLKDWPWAFPTYTFEVITKKKKVQNVQLNPSGKIADIDLKNDVFKVE